MVTSEERMRILRMVEEGKISPEEAARLLEALQRRTAVRRTSERMKGRFLRVRVYEGGEAKVNVNVPLRLLDVGLNVASRFLGDEQVREISDALLEALDEDLTGKIVEVVDEEDGERVEIFIE